MKKHCRKKGIIIVGLLFALLIFSLFFNYAARVYINSAYHKQVVEIKDDIYKSKYEDIVSEVNVKLNESEDFQSKTLSTSFGDINIINNGENKYIIKVVYEGQEVEIPLRSVKKENKIIFVDGCNKIN